ncbi:hypothetical protein BRC96_09765 [Halobacteriales archaeon QS_6_64_34]|nr:MAG: hypothetical protein BRC96_09765 [Halobacteriales archaeon QS_6_64_34]
MFAATLIYTAVVQTTGLLIVGHGLVRVQPIVALIAVVGLIGGPVAVVGSVLGYAGFQIAQGVFPVWQGATYLVFGLLIHVFRIQSGLTEIRNPLGSITQFAVFSLVVCLSAFGTASFMSWNYMLVGRFPFFPGVFFSGLSLAVSAMLGGVLALSFVQRLVSSQRWQSVTRFLRTGDCRQSGTRSWLLISLGLLFAWVVAGSVISIGFQIFELLPPNVIGRRGYESILIFAETGRFSDADYALQFAIGMTIITLWLASLRRYRVFS